MVDQVIASTLQVYGGNCRTPNLVRLAEKGVVFNNAYTTVPLCTPARGSVFTGLYPHKHGLLYNSTHAAYGRPELTNAETMISTPLRRKNYKCCYIGKWHIGENMGPRDYGFEGTSFAGYGLPSNYVEDYDVFLKENGHPGLREVVARDVIASIDMPSVKFPLGEYPLPEEVRGSEIYGGVVDLPSDLTPAGFVAKRTMEKIEEHKDDSFFLTAAFWGPHHPAFPSSEFAGLHKAEEIKEWGNFRDDLEDKPAIQKRYTDSLHKRFNRESWPLWQKVIALHFDFMSMIDAQIGRILDSLEAHGIQDETMIIFTSDHGDSLGCHGGIWDKGPYAYDEVCKVPMIASGPDIAPRASNALISNMDIYSTILEFCGTDIPANVDSVSFLRVAQGTEESCRDAVFSHFYGFDRRGLFLQRGIRMGKYKYVFNPSSIDEFYDLEEDPCELKNRINEGRQELSGLKKRLYVEMKRSEDPYLQFADELMNIREGNREQ